MRFRAVRRSSMTLAGVVILAIGLACNQAPDDSQLTGQIQSMLNEDSGLHGKLITVRTSAGVVTLSGTVENETQREAATRYASAIPGIKEVVNNLQTTSAIATSAPDQIAQAPASAPATPLEKPRPSTPRRQTEPVAKEMTADELATAAAENAQPDENPTPVQNAASPPPPVAKNVTVPPGTTLTIRLLDPIDSEKAQPGQTFRVTLDSPLQSDGDAMVPSGYDV